MYGGIIHANAATKSTPLRHGRRWDYLELLERIDATGSISVAAKTMGMSYKGAWEAVMTVTKVTNGPINSEVILDIGGGELVAVITHNSVDHLGLAPGVQACALIKASHIILAISS